ncbi:MAG TPA: hypothetical protein VLC74_10425 [Rhizomicrobium sp.]|nr:hypothetical protein [Rhizomicrobium sp.]
MRRMLIVITVLLPSSATFADPVGAPCPDLTPANQWRAAFSAHLDPGLGYQSAKTRAMTRLAREGLLQRKADGGKLTEAHRAELQARLNAVERGQY